MKKFTFAAIALIAALAASFSSCGNSPKANLKNDIDTVRQEFRVAAGELRSSISSKIDGTDFNSLLEQNYAHVLTAFNNNSSVIEMSVSGIDIYSNGRSENNRLIRFSGNGMNIWRTGANIGKIGTNSWTGYPDYRGLVFDLEYEGSYMTWARKVNSSDTEYTVVLTYARQGAGFQNEGLYFGCNAYSIGKALRHFGADFQRVRSTDDAKAFIVAFWTKRPFLSSIHTVFCVRCREGIMVYNRYNTCIHEEFCGTIDEIVGKRRPIAIYKIS